VSRTVLSPAGLGHRRHRHQRHHGLAGADIALQEPQHAVGAGEVGVDLRDRRPLRRRQREGEGREDALAGAARRLPGAAAAALGGRAHQRQRQLSRQQLVIGEAPPRRRLRRERRRLLRAMELAQRRAEAGPALAPGELRRQPFRQVGQALQGFARQLHQLALRQAPGQRIDRLDARQLGGALRRQDVVGVGHPEPVVEPFDAAADDAP
jgi:hypothetical protein